MTQVVSSTPGAAGAGTEAAIVLWWLPVGAGGHVVRHTSYWWELLDAHRTGRAPQTLFHAALEVRVDGHRYVIEMAPNWGGPPQLNRGVVLTGPVGLRVLGACRLFRYEVRCWRDGTLPDRQWAVGGPVTVAGDDATARSILDCIHQVPTLTWGRQVPRTRDMWNSNSLVAWLLGVCGVPLTDLTPPAGGRAPGWAAGVALMNATTTGSHPARTC